MDLKIFQALALACLAVFTFFISDFRNKKGMLPLLNEKIVSIIKYFYFIPVFIYVYVILNLEDIYLYSYIGLLFTFGGSFLVAKAKIDLGIYHTWAGHILSSTRIITHGIYALIRHPLYTGIGIFIFGGIIVAINNNPFSFFISVIIITLLIIINFFLALSASRESIFLQEMFGEMFLEYKKQVHAFLPIRKYSISRNA